MNETNGTPTQDAYDAVWRQPSKPYLLRARVAGDTIRDLIEALQQLDPDLKHGVEEVARGNGWVEGLGIEPEKYARLEEEVEDKSNYEYALAEIRDDETALAKELRQLAREALQ